MLRKFALGIAAATALGIAAFAPSTASAAPWGWGWHGPHHHFRPFYRLGPPIGVHFAGPGPGCMVKRWVPTPYGPRLRWVNVCY